MRTVLTILVLTWTCGCAVETDPSEDAESGTSAVLTQNALVPNGLVPNGLVPNGLVPNGLVPNGLAPQTLSSPAAKSLADSGQGGDLSRLFLRYAVGCAFDKTQAFTASWKDATGTEHQETYRGELGLAPEWHDGPLSLDRQRWVSACIAARTNYFGVSVSVSLRGADPALNPDAQEREAYNQEEGVFWGNLFTAEPHMRACSTTRNIANSRNSKRVCATGFVDDQDKFVSCNNIEPRGECDWHCSVYNPQSGAYNDCDGTHEAISVFLRNPQP